MYKCLTSCHLGIIGQRISPFLLFSCDSLENEFRLLKKRVVIDSSMPSELPRKGLDAMRQWYQQVVVYCDYSLRNQSQIVQYPARFLLNNAATSPEKNK
jgi:hypothetical protein